MDLSQNGYIVSKLQFLTEKRVSRILLKHGLTDVKKQTVPSVSRHRDEWTKLAKEAAEKKNAKESKSFDCLQSDIEAEVEDNGVSSDASESSIDNRPLVGDLVYLSLCGRPDITESVLSAARCPFKSLQKRMLMHVLGYLRSHPDIGVCWDEKTYERFKSTYAQYLKGSYKSPQLVVFCDASFLSCPSTSRSVSGILICLFGVPIFWKSSRQTLVTLATIHAEVVALAEAIQLGQSLSFTSLLCPPRGDSYTAFPPVLCDSETGITAADNGMRSAGTKHFHARERLCAEVGDNISHAPAALNRSDGLTKPCTGTMLRNLLRPGAVKVVTFKDT